MQHEEQRRALLPVMEAELPQGLTSQLPAHWWWEPRCDVTGMVVLARRLSRERRAELRAAGRLKKNPDKIAQREHRAWLNHKWRAMAKGADLDQPWSFDRLFTVSTAIH